ncbi:MAG: aminoacyl-tRNA hydrolase [Desulfovibrionaceae bacterium]|nr:aminoacyl-tRNA hydrolase [Desulfovibrionaceae bacterium]
MNAHGIIACLGNPGSQYEGTRHNMGFAVADALRKRLGHMPVPEPEPLPGGRFQSLLWRCVLPGCDAPWLLAMPQTFMNLSGDAVQPLMAWYKLKPCQLLVVHDDIDLAPGRLKLKWSGGTAGHNGLKSIAARLGTQDFHRLRVGVGRPPDAGNVIPWVLGHFSAEPKALVEAALPEAVDAILHFALDGPARAANTVNTRRKTAEASA